MADEKDRLGNKLRDVERAREDQYFAQRDRELLEKLKKSKAQDQESALREASVGRCPKCGQRLEERVINEVTVDECPGCEGLWFDKGEYESLAKREKDGWFARLLARR